MRALAKPSANTCWGPRWRRSECVGSATDSCVSSSSDRSLTAPRRSSSIRCRSFSAWPPRRLPRAPIAFIATLGSPRRGTLECSLRLTAGGPAPFHPRRRPKMPQPTTMLAAVTVLTTKLRLTRDPRPIARGTARGVTDGGGSGGSGGMGGGDAGIDGAGSGGAGANAGLCSAACQKKAAAKCGC